MNPADHFQAAKQQLVDEANARQALIASLVQDIEAGLRVLRSRDGANLSDDQLRDRANDVAHRLLTKYKINKETM